jgi:very-short-patch-repair endonuclease
MLTGPGRTIGRARGLRSAMSLPEVLLWTALRKRPGGHKFRRQHPAGRYVLDFACLERRLAVEIDGESHGMGRNGYLDAVRDDWLMQQGFVTLRISARDVLNNLEGVLVSIMQCEAQPLRRRFAPPPPRPGEDL